MIKKVALALLVAAASAEEPVCCSLSTETGCSNTHPCRQIESMVEPESIAEEFKSWLSKFEKKYATVEEYAYRLAIFAANAAYVREANLEGTYSIGHNQFSDLTEDEFAAYNRLQPRAKPSQVAPLHVIKGGADDAVDWRTKGAVLPVKNQGSCGSCWTFSAVASIESAHFLKANKLVSLSEQNLVDCVKKEKLPGSDDECCDGCSGGLMDNAFDYIISSQAGGIETEDAYAYTGKDGTCAFSAADVGATISNWTDVKVADEVALADAVSTHGVVSIALDASKQWQMYSGGVLSPRKIFGCSSDPNKADHGVAIVGYGTDSDSGKDYWIIRNSWADTWGEKGYMRLERGVNACGVANFATYPIAA